MLIRLGSIARDEEMIIVKSENSNLKFTSLQYMDDNQSFTNGISNDDLAVIRKSLERDGWAAFTSPLFTELGLLARSDYLTSMAVTKIHAPDESFGPSDLERRPWRKLAIGSQNGLGEPYAQLLQTTYFDEADKQFNGLTNLFRELRLLRNSLLEIPSDFGTNRARDRFWNACRIHHYPIGGGFMMEHQDTHFPRVLEGSNLPFLQVMMLLSSKGRDYSTGGGFVVSRDGERLDFENDFGIGTLILFDGSIRHGVADVDRHEILDFDSQRGRLAAFVNVYEMRI